MGRSLDSLCSERELSERFQFLYKEFVTFPSKGQIVFPKKLLIELNMLAHNHGDGNKALVEQMDNALF